MSTEKDSWGDVREISWERDLMGHTRKQLGWGFINVCKVHGGYWDIGRPTRVCFKQKGIGWGSPKLAHVVSVSLGHLSELR